MVVCLQGMSSCDESLSGCGSVPVKAVSPVVPVAEASLSLCPVLPVNGLLEQDQSPCGRGSIVVCTKRDCRLGVVVPSGCNDDGCRCSSMERRHNLCFFQFTSERRVSLACRMAPRLQLVWKRGPLAPVVGERQVNLVSRPVWPWGKSPKLCG